MLTNLRIGFQPGEGPIRELLRDSSRYQASSKTKSDIFPHFSRHQHGLSCKNFQRGKTDAQKLPQIAAAKSGAELKMTNFKYPNILFTQNIAVSAGGCSPPPPCRREIYIPRLSNIYSSDYSSSHLIPTKLSEYQSTVTRQSLPSCSG